jgi:hypothetical protein
MVVYTVENRHSFSKESLFYELMSNRLLPHPLKQENSV